MVTGVNIRKSREGFAVQVSDTGKEYTRHVRKEQEKRIRGNKKKGKKEKKRKNKKSYNVVASLILIYTFA